MSIEFMGVTTLSETLEAMIQGLLDADEDPNFEIDMMTFGTIDLDTRSKCFGCAATCTLQNLRGKPFAPKEIYDLARRAAALDFTLNLKLFEEAVDCARRGDIAPLLDFFELRGEWQHDTDIDFCLTSANWRSELPKVRALIERLKEAGI